MPFHRRAETDALWTKDSTDDRRRCRASAGLHQLGVWALDSGLIGYSRAGQDSSGLFRPLFNLHLKKALPVHHSVHGRDNMSE